MPLLRAKVKQRFTPSRFRCLYHFHRLLYLFRRLPGVAPHKSIWSSPGGDHRNHASKQRFSLIKHEADWGGNSPGRHGHQGGASRRGGRRLAAARRPGRDSPLRDAPRHYRVRRHFLRGPFLITLPLLLRDTTQLCLGTFMATKGNKHQPRPT